MTAGPVVEYRPLGSHRLRAPRWDRTRLDPLLYEMIAVEGLTDREAAGRLGFDDPGVVRSHRCRLGLAVNPEPKRSLTMEGFGRPFVDRPNPLELASQHLPGFDWPTMTRWGRAIKLREVIRELNPILKQRGIGQVGPEELHA